MAKVSVLLLTIDRFFLTREYVGTALKQAGHEFDLCITDNGSTCPEILKWNESQNAKVYIRNEKNQGTAQSLNKMIELNPSDYYVFIGNDIQLPKDWLKTLVEYNEAIPESGVIGIDWRGREKGYPKKEINGKTISLTPDAVFGTMFFSHTLRTKLGKFCEDYGPYGLWDGDWSIRAKAAGHINYYLPKLTSHHFGNDAGEQTPYRKMKDESMKKAGPKYHENLKKYQEGNYYI